MSSAARLLVSGLVQGVGFRYWTQRAARQLGLEGWVRNLHDGRVEIWVEGDPVMIDELERRCLRGPPSAAVSEILRESREPQGARGFSTLRDASADR